MSHSARRTDNTATHVALLRGVNVGGKNKLPMAKLQEIFTQAGCTNVRSYIQSGNIVFAATRAIVATLPALVAERIAQRFGFTSPVVLRSATQMRHIVAANPFLRDGADVNLSPRDCADVNPLLRDRVDVANLHVAFLADKPTASRVTALDPARSPGDCFAVLGQQIYLHLPSGAGKTKLTNAYFDSALSTISTMRNWRTVLALKQMAGDDHRYG